MQRLLPGQYAPPFRKIATDGRVVDLETYAGSRVLLIFYRYAGCPFCCAHLGDLVQRESELKGYGVEVIAVLESPQPVFSPMVCGKNGAFFPIISDPTQELYRLYGVSRSWKALLSFQAVWRWLAARSKGFRQGKIDGNLNQLPAAFLIRGDGTVEVAYYGRNAADQIPWWRIERFMKAGAEPQDDPWAETGLP